MDSQIHGHKNDAGNGIGHIAMPAIKEYRDMVIPVQKHEWLFVNDNEKRIQQFSVI